MLSRLWNTEETMNMSSFENDSLWIIEAKAIVSSSDMPSSSMRAYISSVIWLSKWVRNTRATSVGSASFLNW